MSWRAESHAIWAPARTHLSWRRHLKHHEHTFVHAPVMNDPDYAQRTLLGLLLEHHPAMLTADEIHRLLSGVLDVDDAIAHLSGDGLINRLGDMIGASRAAVRGAQLAG
jgi:hypothetical protein